jgi:hypothetical protein
VREFTDVHFPEAERIRVVLDNLSTHSAGSLYQAFPPCEARRVLRRLAFHYVPKHASWLNMVEIEIGVLRSQCLNRRIATRNISYPRSLPGNDSAMPPELASNGCSQPKKPAPKWVAPTRSPVPLASPTPKSHNYCAAALAPGVTIPQTKLRSGRFHTAAGQISSDLDEERQNAPHTQRWAESRTSLASL